METIATSPEVLSFAKGAIIFLCIAFVGLIAVAAIRCCMINKGEEPDEDEDYDEKVRWIENVNTEIISAQVMRMSAN